MENAFEIKLFVQLFTLCLPIACCFHKHCHIRERAWWFCGCISGFIVASIFMSGLISRINPLSTKGWRINLITSKSHNLTFNSTLTLHPSSGTAPKCLWCCKFIIHIRSDKYSKVLYFISLNFSFLQQIFLSAKSSLNSFIKITVKLLRQWSP